jgi:hypothetical protein
LRRGIAGGLIAALALAGCAGSDSQPATSTDKAAFEAYLRKVEPIRLDTNRLLDRADPILSAYAEHRIGPAEAQRRVDALERRFADFAVQIAALRPVPRAIRAEHRAYAHTYIFEDSYLSALAEAVPDREFDDLPDTKDRQRSAIIAWRTRLEVVAERLGVTLPDDLQVAGRGEIAPSPVGD